MKPDFLIVGAARSGTTSLFQYMEHHPDIRMSRVKELNFFSNEKYWRKGLKWYQKRFQVPSHVPHSVVTGEASTSYTCSPIIPGVPRRIFEHYPDMKLIYVVRSPVERFISQYMQRTRAGMETRELQALLDNLENEMSAWQGRYFHQIQEYRKFFPSRQLLVVSFDDIKADTNATLRRIAEFLGVRHVELEQAESSKVHNAADTVVRKNRFGLAVLWFYHAQIEQRDLPFPLKRLFTRLANLGGTTVQKPHLTDHQRRQLESFYWDDAGRLEEEYTIATKHWFQCPQPEK
ncbi:hypothetical protein CF392_02555 [Tamilnaduibacter salinus]|uniref:Sulfotransferase domain-containing protein n=1 Tax=Tamilnaduibacter salinus TaxID=1484056 RepID=A0A2A2I5W1_9GAMM|nr:sulfotransferase [Tamilnaduibacter salinus]PAV27037.1 hypothetical protein CF392_02555 [Tamilnaduibacter salinus]